MRKIGIIAKKGEPEAVKAVVEFLKCLKGREFKFYIESELASLINVKGHPVKDIPARSDIIIVFGGDGTLLGVARLVGSRGTPILGVNLGGLGFITELGRDEICENIDMVFSEECCFEERIMLLADVYRGRKKIAQQSALNDIVLNKSALARMLELDLDIDGQYVSSFRADGLVISTPTGSTAHSLSAGGPILYPTLETFLITPICPHTLTSRPIVLPDTLNIEIHIKRGEDAYLTLDGQVGVPMETNDRIKIKKADYKARFLTLHDRDYFKVLRTKLKWSE
ncbi:MAG TPA: NAD(+)/NADH kinase [Nitrospirae bacterium]|nr:putative inorganic polyphosphate/ATP-NAD kinase [bacterium BMS3Abin09]GBE40342.1 putative inorganic polyphosphate/ATP-NAD kinase [bacterium BMS3Bbin09]HDH33860.1 NAD(+)/NADH kinase [Nitrospirota bacterium]HDN95207.1 NAD(+)/NADH kinase [Nitrospirota bacterium]HDO67102.1 NAD(+)/NADH kinase [Nitrospirota bacterium]